MVSVAELRRLRDLTEEYSAVEYMWGRDVAEAPVEQQGGNHQARKAAARAVRPLMDASQRRRMVEVGRPAKEGGYRGGGEGKHACARMWMWMWPRLCACLRLGPLIRPFPALPLRT